MADSNNLPRTVLDLAPSLTEPGFRLVDAGQLLALFEQIFSVTPNVAATGNNYLTGKQLTSAVNTVLSANASNYAIILPPALLGKQIIVINSTTVALSVFPNSQTDYIIPAGSGSPSASASQASNTTAAYICIAQTPATAPTLINYWKQAAPV